MGGERKQENQQKHEKIGPIPLLFEDPLFLYLLCFLGFLLLPKRHFHLLEECPSTCIVPCGCCNRDLKTKEAGGIGGRGNFRKHGVLLESNRIVTVTIQSRGNTTEITHTRESDMQQLIQKCFHALATERDHSTHNQAFADLKIADRLTCSAEDRLLPRDLLQAFDDVLLHLFAIHLGPVDTHIHYHLRDPRKCVRVRFLQTRLERFCNRTTQPIMESHKSHYLVSEEALFFAFDSFFSLLAPASSSTSFFNFRPEANSSPLTLAMRSFFPSLRRYPIRVGFFVFGSRTMTLLTWSDAS